MDNAVVVDGVDDVDFYRRCMQHLGVEGGCYTPIRWIVVLWVADDAEGVEYE
jgi:hypothetical protein